MIKAVPVYFFIIYTEYNIWHNLIFLKSKDLALLKVSYSYKISDTVVFLRLLYNSAIKPLEICVVTLNLDEHVGQEKTLRNAVLKYDKLESEPIQDKLITYLIFKIFIVNFLKWISVNDIFILRFFLYFSSSLPLCCLSFLPSEREKKKPQRTHHQLIKGNLISLSYNFKTPSEVGAFISLINICYNPNQPIKITAVDCIKIKICTHNIKGNKYKQI